jgi:hypothetical protein
MNILTIRRLPVTSEVVSGVRGEAYYDYTIDDLERDVVTSSSADSE